MAPARAWLSRLEQSFLNPKGAPMLSDHTPMITLATADTERSRAFYEGVLGMQPEDEFGGGIAYRAGSSRLFVYPSAFAGTNKATAAAFELAGEDFDAEVQALREAGVAFDTFEVDGMHWEDGISEMDGMRNVWFRDPDGNVLNVGTRG
jgi:catechol 2,3-dioxygenase-like lactoylglutathione lyase family enzyme